jgi:hypothetical protein
MWELSKISIEKGILSSSKSSLISNKIFSFCLFVFKSSFAFLKASFVRASFLPLFGLIIFIFKILDISF